MTAIMPAPVYALARAASIPTLVIWHADGRFTRLEGAPCEEYAAALAVSWRLRRHDPTQLGRRARPAAADAPLSAVAARDPAQPLAGADAADPAAVAVSGDQLRRGVGIALIALVGEREGIRPRAPDFGRDHLCRDTARCCPCRSSPRR